MLSTLNLGDATLLLDQKENRVLLSREASDLPDDSLTLPGTLLLVDLHRHSTINALIYGVVTLHDHSLHVMVHLVDLDDRGAEHTRYFGSALTETLPLNGRTTLRLDPEKNAVVVSFARADAPPLLFSYPLT